jgi:ferrous iron transport protein B
MNLEKSTKKIKIALVGNPNVGKSALFNALTNSRQTTGNWPGITVEQKKGLVRAIPSAELIDLPGVYSLSSFLPEEIITRNFLLDNKYDLILNILNVTNLERNLYLTTQLLEFDAPIIIVLNMADLLSSKEQKIINFAEFENQLKAPVILASVIKNVGINNILMHIKKEINNKDKTSKKHAFFLNSNTEKKISKMNEILFKPNDKKTNKRFILSKILEGDKLILSKLDINFETGKKIYCEKLNKDEEIINLRYKFISNLVKNVTENSFNLKKTLISRKIDKVVTGKYTAIPFFLCIILVIFYTTFGPIGSFLQNLMHFLIEKEIKYNINSLLLKFNSNVILSEFINSIITGVGEVVSFLPQILLLFGQLSLLEDSGYMARAAFILDKILRKLGLSGRAFVPLIMGLGCSVPAILSTRILENKEEKNLNIFLIPFIPCNAKMTVFLLLISSFFPSHKILIMFSLYIFSILLAILTAFLLKNTIFLNSDSTLIMEMPNYKIPFLKSILILVSERLKDFLKHAGTVIFGSSVAIWILKSFDLTLKYTNNTPKSILAYFGRVISPIFAPCGFGNWQTCVALLTGLVSKESIISTMSVIYEGTKISNAFSIPMAASFLMFTLLYSPCIGAISSAKKELGSITLTAVMVAYQMIVAWIFSSLTFHIAKLFV